MIESEVILKVGAEGGGINLYGRRGERGWSFSRNVIDQTPTLLDESAIEHTSKLVDTWPDALALIDKYPWHKLHPLTVHPEFRQKVLEAVIARFSSKGDTGSDRLADWNEICGGGGD